MRPTDWAHGAKSPAEVVRHLESGTSVFLHGASATPTPLVSALVARQDLEGLRLFHLHTAGDCPFVLPGMERRVRSVSLFAGPGVRLAIEQGRADFIPIFLSDIPRLFASRAVPLDAALVQLSPPDKHGLCSLGTSVDAARAAVDSARVVLAEINTQMPRTHGAGAVPLSRVTAFTLSDRPLCEAPAAPIGPTEQRIGELIAALVPDGATLQLGIGAIPDATLACLGDKLELGLHTEMFSDGVVPLVEGGVITNRRKKVHKLRSVTSFVSGTRRLFDFVDDNPEVHFLPCDRTNDAAIIAQNDDVVAVNSALSLDLTGQVSADSLGHRIYSGIGGQMDFIRGAALSRNGRPIIALPSTAAGGRLSRIVSALEPGAGVVTTRGHVHWVVTEYGAVNLHGRALRERAESLISIAHPDFRAELARETRRIRCFDLGAS